MDQQKWEQLKTRLAKLAALQGAGGILTWDMQVMMPPGGVQGRSDQLGTIGALAHEFFVDEEMGALLDELYEEAQAEDFDADDVSTVRVNRREYEKAVRVPNQLVAELMQASTLARQAWQQARAENNFAHFEPYLSKNLDIAVRMAEAIGSESGNLYDALLDQYESGTTYEYINAVFAELKAPLVELVKEIATHQDRVSDDVLRRHYPEKDQIEFARMVITALGYDFERGRLDHAAHPFAGGASWGDVRITTRVDENFLPTCLMATIHEAGHAIHFQQGQPHLWSLGIPVPGLSTCESQSRFYENMVGRSRAFWTYWFPQLQAQFPHLQDITLDTFYRAVNRSQPSLIRVEADEVTYGLHIMLRFELENDLINGRVKVADLPREWNERMEAYLGVTPPTDAEGVLQDVHWSGAMFGYFPTYLLGNILAGQLWEAMRRDLPDVEHQISCGQFENVLEWQRSHIHQYGGKYTLPEITERAVGGPLAWQPYMNYLRAKYSEVYGL